MNKATNNTNEVVNLHPVVIRLNPVTNTPVVFIADKPPVNDQVELVLEGNEHRTVNYEYYKHTIAMTDESVNEVAQKYAEAAGVPYDSLHIRSRLPKKTSDAPKKPRKHKTNDANLNGGGQPFRRRASDKEEDKQESSQDYRSKDELAQAAQSLQDQHDAEKKPVEDGKATPDNPQGATVTPIKAKRAYNKRDPKEKVAKAQKSKRSQAALRRYHEELQKSQEKTDLQIEQATSAATPEQHNEAILKLAAEIAAVLIKNKDVL